MNTSLIIQNSAHKLSLVQGVYVISQQEKVCAVCTSIKLLTEWLDGVKYKDAADVRITLASVDDYDTDDVTHLIADDLMGDYKSYENYSSDQGHAFPWLEYWFDEITGSEFVRDIKRRTDRHREIHAPTERYERSEALQAAE
jgi:hypothetical protein